MDATLARIRQIKKRPDLRFPEREIVGLYDKYLVTDESQIKERFFVLTKVNSYKILMPCVCVELIKKTTKRITEKRPVPESKSPVIEKPVKRVKREEENDNKSDNKNDNSKSFSPKNDVKNELRKFISPSAEAMVAGEEINSLGKRMLIQKNYLWNLGEPYGKELTGFNLVELAEKSGAIGAKFVRKFGDYSKPMGCDVMKDEVIVCNMNQNSVQFHELDGTEALRIDQTSSGRSLYHPSSATVLLGQFFNTFFILNLTLLKI